MRHGLLAAALWLVATTAWASPAFCGQTDAHDAAQQDRLLRVAAALQRVLDGATAPAALVARSGLKLRRVSLTYSHAGLALRAHPAGAWAVRQLYYDCDQGLPRLYDQGLPGFVLGMGDADLGHLSVVLLPGPAGAQAAAAALDDALAKALLAARYSANAFAWATHYQNCNQWVAELLAAAWAPLADGPALRERAQGWLQAAGYAPSAVDVASPLVQVVALFSPWLHADDHPEADIKAARIRVSTPESLAAFALAQVPGARQIELCHTAQHLVVREGGPPLPSDCTPAATDRVLPL
ncbi:MAG: DUF2145 domain-containing protein [Proteobacteria bacterium]|nr:DUF2145 domain-containing protein [Pseudomonadota bacterium]